MLHFTEGLHCQISAKEKSRLFQYRYQVFVKRLGWQLDTAPDVEMDQFDHNQTLHVIASNEEDIVGCARLLPTTLPYLLETVFPELLNGMPPPKDQSVWELSRFTSIDLKSKPLESCGQLSSETTEALLKRAMAIARDHGAEHIISVSPIGIERLLRKLGVIARRAGPPMLIDGFPLIACQIDLIENTGRY